MKQHEIVSVRYTSHLAVNCNNSKNSSLTNHTVLIIHPVSLAVVCQLCCHILAQVQSVSSAANCPLSAQFKLSA